MVPFGPWTLTAEVSVVTVTPAGISIGLYPTLDIWLSPAPHAFPRSLGAGSEANQEMLQRISPPTPALRAALPVITPRGVVRMFTPIPPITLGIPRAPV